MNSSVPESNDLIRQAVRLAVHRSGRSQASIARTSGVSKNHLSRYLIGRQEMHSGSLELLFSDLGIELVVPPGKPIAPCDG